LRRSALSTTEMRPAQKKIASKAIQERKNKKQQISIESNPP
jgi:hypothetical protein